jgi:hypothetical protein
MGCDLAEESRDTQAFAERARQKGICLNEGHMGWRAAAHSKQSPPEGRGVYPVAVRQCEPLRI